MAILSAPHRTPSCSMPRTGLTLIEVLVPVGFIGLILIAIALLLPPVTRGSRPAARRTQCKSNLRQIGLALHNYVDVYGTFPPAYTVDEYGNPLHSWRTLILPYLDQPTLYDKIDLSKPWDDPVNSELGKQVYAYQCAEFKGPSIHTTYMAVVGSNALFNATPRSIAEITDGTSNTLMVIEVDADHAVPWMSPQDADAALVLSLGSSKKPPHVGGMHAALADGTVRFLSAKTSKEVLQALISIDGKDNADLD